jgi:hypothetical protein
VNSEVIKSKYNLHLLHEIEDLIMRAGGGQNSVYESYHVCCIALLHSSISLFVSPSPSPAWPEAPGSSTKVLKEQPHQRNHQRTAIVDSTGAAVHIASVHWFYSSGLMLFVSLPLYSYVLIQAHLRTVSLSWLHISFRTYDYPLV